MQRRLRIAVLTRNFSTTGGGAESYAIALVEQLAQQHEVHVYAQTIAHDFPGVHYHRVPMPLERPRWINQLYFAWATWRATRTGFDIVHAHENTWHGNVHTVHVLPVKHSLFADKRGVALAARWLKVLTSPRLLAYLWLEHRRYAWAPRKQIVAASDSLGEVIRTTFPRATPMVSSIPPGVHTAPGLASPTQRHAARVALGLPAAPSTWLLFVGNDVVRKGLPTVLNAMAQLPEQVGLLVVGQGDDHGHARAWVRERGLDARVRFLGAVRGMDTVYSAADVLVHPTLEDTFGMVVLEAMAHGLPTVVSAPPYCGVSALVHDGQQACLLQDPRDANALVRAVRQLVPGSAPYLAMAQAAHTFASVRTWPQVAAGYERILQAAAQAPRQRWLVLAHCFNMDGRAASQTITDKLPHLAAAGIELVVLSGVSGYQDQQHEHHRLWPVGAAGIRFELRHVLRRWCPHPVVYRAAMLPLSLVLLPFFAIEKLLRPVESSWSWWISAYLMGWLLARRKKYDLIYSTGGAFAAHLAGRALKRSLTIPWLAEVHDPLVMPGSTPRTAQERMQARVERMICAEADVAIWFTEQALASAQGRHPLLGRRGHCMLPGIDAPFRDFPPHVPGHKMVIGHFGSLSNTRNLTPIIKALEALVSLFPSARTQVELQLTGGPLDPVSQACLALSPVHPMVRHLGRVEADPVTKMSGREQILQRMRSTDVLLLLHGDEPICAEYIPSKMYEYLWMQRPILATVHQNPQMAELLRAQGHTACESDTELREALQGLYTQWTANGLADRGCPSPYTTQAAVQQMLNWVAA